MCDHTSLDTLPTKTKLDDMYIKSAVIQAWTITLAELKGQYLTNKTPVLTTWFGQKSFHNQWKKN